ncbi:MAG: hypothetical protein IJS02_02695 [Bacteroidales bacterium]|nr:hypothetical protein [Bacteroidales bacterium]
MVYKYKVTIAGVKSFFRDYELKPETTLFRLNSYIMNDLDFSPDQMVLFCGLNEKGESTSRYGLFDLGSGSMDRVTLKDTLAKKENVLHYFYDLRRNKFLVLTFIEECDENPRLTYPRTVAEKGRNPEQFADKYEDWDTADDSSIMDVEEVAEFGDDPSDE